MAVNKVVYKGNTLIDLTDSTITAASVLAGFIGYDRSGTKITGTASSGGVGGLPSGVSAMTVGNYTVSTDFTTSRQTVTHNLGVVPDLVIFMATANVATTYSMLFAARGSIMNYRSGYNSHNLYHGNSTSTVTYLNTNNSSYGVSNLTATTFQIASTSSSYYWRKGTYKWFAIKFS